MHYHGAVTTVRERDKPYRRAKNVAPDLHTVKALTAANLAS
jgi:hypothetical protein